MDGREMGFTSPGFYNLISAQRLQFDATAPAPVTNLTASMNVCGTIHLAWTAPGDDGTSGQAAAYDLRWSDHAINASNFASAWPLSAPSPPAPAGSQDIHDESEVPACTHFYFALKTRDEIGNWSTLSNVTGFSTPCDGCGGFSQQPSRELPERLALEALSPNPAHAAFAIRYAIPAAQRGAEFDISIFDVSGRRVRALEHGTATPGRSMHEWDLRTDGGGPARGGLYFVTLRVGAERRTRSVIVTPTR
jgi:hypothetical protein